MILLYYVIKECNHGTNAIPFHLFREQRPPNIFCQELFGIDWWLCKMVLSYFSQRNAT